MNSGTGLTKKKICTCIKNIRFARKTIITSYYSIAIFFKGTGEIHVLRFLPLSGLVSVHLHLSAAAGEPGPGDRPAAHPSHLPGLCPGLPRQEPLPRRDYRHPQGVHHSGLLLCHELRGHLHALPHDQVPVGHQALLDVQYDRSSGQTVQVFPRCF